MIVSISPVESDDCDLSSQPSLTLNLAITWSHLQLGDVVDVTVLSVCV